MWAKLRSWAPYAQLLIIGAAVLFNEVRESAFYAVLAVLVASLVYDEWQDSK
jgi:hypothetical protein